MALSCYDSCSDSTEVSRIIIYKAHSCLSSIQLQSFALANHNLNNPSILKMSLIVENEIQWLTTSILPEILRNGRLLDNYSESLANTFQVESIDISIIGTDEAYMLTLCYRATINFKYAGEQQQRKLIVKVRVENENIYFTTA